MTTFLVILSKGSCSRISRRRAPEVRMVVVPVLMIIVALLTILSKGLLTVLVAALIGHLCWVLLLDVVHLIVRIQVLHP